MFDVNRQENTDSGQDQQSPGNSNAKHTGPGNPSLCDAISGAQDGETGVARCYKAIKSIAITLVVVPTLLGALITLVLSAFDTFTKSFIGIATCKFFL